MSTKMNKRSGLRTASLVAAAVAGPAALLVPAVTFAAPIVTVTTLGTPSDSSPAHSGTGWVAYEITITADSGDGITEVDLGNQTTSPTNGLYGTFLQNWVPATKKVPAQPTPIESGSEGLIGGAYGLDSHILVPAANQVQLPAPFEDSNLTQPTPGPISDSTDTFGTGTFIHGIFGLTTATAQLALAYVVMPVGQSGTYALNATEAPLAGGGGTGFNGLTGSIGGSSPPPTNAIVSLTTAAPTTYGSLAGTVTATGTGTSYVAGTKAISPPSGKAYVNGVLSGTPSGTTEIYALDITNSTGGAPTDLTAIDSAIAAVSGVTAVSGTNPGPFPAGYNVFITFNPAPTPASNFLGFDLTGTGSDSDLVASVALVPEPASAAFILVGASSLLLGRRKRATSQVA